MGNSATRQAAPRESSLPQVQGPAAWITHDVFVTHVLDDAMPVASVASLARTCKYYASLVRSDPALLLGDAVRLRFDSVRGDPSVSFVARVGRWRRVYNARPDDSELLASWLEWIRRGRASTLPVHRRVWAELVVPRTGLAHALSVLNPRAIVAAAGMLEFDKIKVCELYSDMAADYSMGRAIRPWVAAIPEYASAFTWRGASYQEYIAAAYSLFDRASVVEWKFDSVCCHLETDESVLAFTQDFLSLLFKTRDKDRWPAAPVPAGKWRVCVPKEHAALGACPDDDDDAAAHAQLVVDRITSPWALVDKGPIAVWRNLHVDIKYTGATPDDNMVYCVPAKELVDSGTLELSLVANGVVCAPACDFKATLRRIHVHVRGASGRFAAERTLTRKAPSVRWECDKLCISVWNAARHDWPVAINLATLAVAPTRVLVLLAHDALVDIAASPGRLVRRTQRDMCVHVLGVGYFAIMARRARRSGHVQVRAGFLGPDEVIGSTAYETAWRHLGIAIVYVAPCLLNVGFVPAAVEAQAALDALAANPILQSACATYEPFRRYVVAAENALRGRAAAAATS